MTEISYLKIFGYGIKDSIGPGSVTVLLIFAGFLSLLGNDAKGLFSVGLFFMLTLLFSSIMLITGSFDVFLSTSIVNVILLGVNFIFALFFIVWGIRNVRHWYQLRSQSGEIKDSQTPGFMMIEATVRRKNSFWIFCVSVFLGILSIVITSVWAFDYPMFTMFYQLMFKYSVKSALPSLISYIFGQWFLVLCFWIMALGISAKEQRRIFVGRFLSLSKICVAAVCLSTGFSVIYLLLNTRINL